MAKLLIDECLHTSLLELAHAAGHSANHVNYLGLGSSKDWELMKLIPTGTTSSSRTTVLISGPPIGGPNCMPAW